MSADCASNCQEALANLGRYLDGELPETDLRSIAEHLAACYPCADRASFDEQLRALVRRGCAPEEPPRHLLVRVRARLDQIQA